MTTNKIFIYYLEKGNIKGAMRIKKAYWIQNEPHQKSIRKERRLKFLFDKLREMVE